MPRSTEQSARLFARAKELFPGGVNSPVRAFKSVGGEPFMVSRAQGPYLYDADGNSYIDYINSWGPLVLGHAHPLVRDAINAQAEKGTSYGACAAIEADLAEAVIKLYPSIERIRFVNSGTEAGMAVVRLARAFTKRDKIIKFAGCYHGHVDSMLVQAGSGVMTLGIPDSAGVPSSFTQDTLTASFNDAASVRQLFEKFPGQVGAVILEPVVGNAGLLIPQSGFLEELRRITTEYGALLIFDEVMTGFRVALGGAQTLFKIKPDLTMLGKVIGGGLPVGAFGGRKEIMEMLAPLGPVYQAGTLSGNPLAMAAGLATLKEWSRAGVFEQTQKHTEELVAGLQQSAKKAGVPISSGSIGTMFGFFFQEGPVHNYEDAKRSDVSRFRKFFHALLEEGVYIAPSQFEAGFVSAAHGGDVIAKTLHAFERAMKLI